MADAAQAGIASNFPGVAHTLSKMWQELDMSCWASMIDMASAYATLAASGIYHPPHFTYRSGQCQQPGPLRRQHRGQHRRSAHPKAVAERDCGDGAITHGLFAWPQPSGWAGFGGGPALRNLVTPPRTKTLDGRVHAVVVYGCVGGHRQVSRATGNRFGCSDLRLGACRPSGEATMDGALKGVGWTSTQTGRGRWLCTGVPAAAAGGTTLRPSSAHGRNCAGLPPPIGPDHHYLAPPPPAPPLRLPRRR